MTDLTTDAGIAAVQARLRGESDRLTDADLDAIERDRFAVSRLGEPTVRETRLDKLAIRKLLAEVRRRQAAEKRVLAVARELRYKNADTHDIVGRFLAALDGEQ